MARFQFARLPDDGELLERAHTRAALLLGADPGARLARECAAGGSAGVARSGAGCSMRVIAGSLGGRRLQAPKGTTTRPTSDRVREALFSMLGPLDDARVLDLYAGSGALG